jgi:hypothetical protein
LSLELRRSRYWIYRPDWVAVPRSTSLLNRILGHLLIPSPKLTKMLICSSQYLVSVKVAGGVGYLLVVVTRYGHYDPVSSIKDRELVVECDCRQPA